MPWQEAPAGSPLACRHQCQSDRKASIAAQKIKAHDGACDSRTEASTGKAGPASATWPNAKAVKTAMLRMNEAAATTARLNVWSGCSIIAECQGQSARYALDVRSCLHSFYGLPELHFVTSRDLRRNIARAGCRQQLPEPGGLAVLHFVTSHDLRRNIARTGFRQRLPERH